jgi:hypothetical protein
MKPLTFQSARLYRLLAVLVVCALSGCGHQRLPTAYGERGTKSVAGTGVLGAMFQQAGHRVTSWRYLSPRLREADTIVWAPDRFAPPEPKTIAWLDEWLDAGDRTLIYIGRDFSAAVAYWETVLPGATGILQPAVQSELAMAKSEFAAERQPLVARPRRCEWFTVVGSKSGGKITRLDGPWAAGIDAGKAEIELPGRVIPQPGAEVLLASGKDVIASRYVPFQNNTRQRIVIANGSFLLNAPLVNHEHRKLAAKLIASTGAPGDVVFLESGPNEPKILDEDPAAETPTGLEVFFVWPLNFILLHLALLGIVFAFARAPIFGIPRRLPAPTLSDFARHVSALGELLHGTRDREYAVSRIQHYQQLLREGRRKNDE